MESLEAAVLVMLVDLHNGSWNPDPPNVDEADVAKLSVAAGEVNEEWLTSWLRERVRFSSHKRFARFGRDPITGYAGSVVQ